MSATLPLNGDGDITQNSSTPANGKYKLANAGSSVNGKTLTIEGSNGGAGNTNGGDIVLTPGSAAGSGTSGNVKVSGNRTIDFNVFDSYPRIVFGGASPVINWPSSNNIYFGEDAYTGYFIIRGTKVGIGTTTPSEKLHVNGKVKIGNWTIEG